MVEFGFGDPLTQHLSGPNGKCVAHAYTDHFPVTSNPIFRIWQIATSCPGASSSKRRGHVDISAQGKHFA